MALTSFLDSQEKALFGVFDGHGGREVAIYCSKSYPDLLKNETGVKEKEGVEEWLR